MPRCLCPRHGKVPVLRQRQEFLRVQNGGERFRGHRMLLFVAANEEGAARIGYTVSRKVGRAVVRNRVRRRLREIIRLNQGLLVEGMDHIVVAFSSAAPASYDMLRDELLWLLRRARGWASAKTLPSD